MSIAKSQLALYRGGVWENAFSILECMGSNIYHHNCQVW